MSESFSGLTVEGLKNLVSRLGLGLDRDYLRERRQECTVNE